MGYIFAAVVEIDPLHSIHPAILWTLPLLTFPIAWLNRKFESGTQYHLKFKDDEISYTRIRRGKILQSLQGNVSKIHVHYFNTRGPRGIYQIYLKDELGHYFNLPEGGYPGQAWKILLDLFQDLEKENRGKGTIEPIVETKITPKGFFKLVLIGIVAFAVTLLAISLWVALTA